MSGVMATSPSKNAWETSSELLEYKNTYGKKQKLTRLTAAWETLSKPPEGATIYAQLKFGEKPDISTNYLMVHSSAKTSDEAVPALAAAADNWNALSQAKDMSSEKVLLADLQTKMEGRVVNQLNMKLEAEGFGSVDFISSAVNQLNNKRAYSQEYRDDLRALLEEFFSGMMGSLEEGKAVVQEWPTVMKWRRWRTDFAHPLETPINEQKLADLKESVSTSDAYKDVRTAARLLLKVAESSSGQ